MKKYPEAGAYAIATNDMDSLDVFNYRKFWKELLSQEYYMRETADLWYDKKLFGKLNLKGESIYPTESRLKEFKGCQQPVLALDFVVEAYTNLQSHMLKAHASQQLNPSGRPEIIQMTPIRSWISVHQLYNSYLETLHDEMISVYFKKAEADDKIEDLTSWNKVQINFLRDVPNLCLTLSGFITSSMTPGRISGLIVEISRTDTKDGDDAEKYAWLEDPNYEFYKASAQNHGFMIDKNAPWRLIADIEHPQMKLHMDENGISNVDELFQEYYYKSYKYDIQNLREHLIGSYNAYVEAYPTRVKASTCATKVSTLRETHLRTSTEHIERVPFSKEYMSYTHPEEYWLEMYYYIRLREMNKPEDPAKFNRDIKKIIQIYRRFGLDKAQDYVNMSIVSMKTTIL